MSDHVPFTITIPIVKEHFQTKKCMIVKNSDEEKSFIKELIRVINPVNTSNLLNSDSLKIGVLDLTHFMKRIWEKYSKVVNITKHFKSWWDDNCKHNLDIYRSTKHIKDWKLFKRMVKNAKHSFFDQKIQEIANKNKEPWKFMKWVNKCKLPTIKAIRYNGRPCIEIEDLWSVLHLSFNMA